MNWINAIKELDNVITKWLLIAVIAAMMFVIQGCGTMKAATNLGQAMFHDAGLVVDGAQQKMVENYRQ
jgi:hypothetical protein